MNEIEINFIKTEDYYDLSVMVGELLNEIMQKINIQAFNYNQVETEKRAKSLIERKKYWVFLAKEQISRKNEALYQCMRAMLYILRGSMEQFQSYMFVLNFAQKMLVNYYWKKQ
jgi:ribosomal 50S subunit-associated protein YjgA (DUF615 family)